jgi:uncharacterized caspase-like protein
MQVTWKMAVFLILTVSCLGCVSRIQWIVPVQTNPPDAEVYTDDKLLCRTPCEVLFDRDRKLTLSKRIYAPGKIEIRKDGYKTITRKYGSGWDVIGDKAYAFFDATLTFQLVPEPPRPTAVFSPAAQKILSSPARSHPEDALTPIPGQRWAVIIGISNYRDTRIAGLRYASADAQAFHTWLISPQGGGYAPSRIRLFLNSEATAQSIRNVLFNWLKQALEEDMITIYFAGHGSPESPDSPNNLFLLPFDANYDDVASTGFPMWDIETALKRFIKAKKVVVIADACHAGGVGQAFDIARRANRGVEINPISSGLQNLSKIGDGVAVISASDDKQYSQEGMAWGGGHGVFTYFLLKGLNGDADYNKDGHVTLGELIPYLSEKVRRETKNAQSPTVAGKFDPALSIGK